MGAALFSNKRRANFVQVSFNITGPELTYFPGGVQMIRREKVGSGQYRKDRNKVGENWQDCMSNVKERDLSGKNIEVGVVENKESFKNLW